MRAHYDCRKLFWKAFRVLRAQFVRFVVSGIALVAVAVILCMMFLTTPAPVTHAITPTTQFIAGEGPGNVIIAFSTSTP